MNTPVGCIDMIWLTGFILLGVKWASSVGGRFLRPDSVVNGAIMNSSTTKLGITYQLSLQNNTFSKGETSYENEKKRDRFNFNGSAFANGVQQY